MHCNICSYIMFAVILMSISCTKSQVPPQLPDNKSKEPDSTPNEPPVKIPSINIASSVGKKADPDSRPDSGTKSNNSVIKPVEAPKQNSTNLTAINAIQDSEVRDSVKVDKPIEVELESGAITRGVLVFVGVGFLFILYVGCQTYRRRRLDKSKTIVKKYGVRTRRSDLEMEPLPLSDEDEDETIFDLSANRNNR